MKQIWQNIKPFENLYSTIKDICYKNASSCWRC